MPLGLNLEYINVQSVKRSGDPPYGININGTHIPCNTIGKPQECKYCTEKPKSMRRISNRLNVIVKIVFLTSSVAVI